MPTTDYTKYQQCTLAEAQAMAVTERRAGIPVYAVGQLLVTEQRTYWVVETPLEGEAFARVLGVPMVDEAGDLYWPWPPALAWLGRWWKRSAQ